MLSKIGAEPGGQGPGGDLSLTSFPTYFSESLALKKISYSEKKIICYFPIPPKNQFRRHCIRQKRAPLKLACKIIFAYKLFSIFDTMQYTGTIYNMHAVL